MGKIPDSPVVGSPNFPSSATGSTVDAPAQATPGSPHMDSQLTTIQPGGGMVMAVELGWGGVRRMLLRRFYPRYVAAMAAKRLGSRGPLGFEPVDSRDLKYFRNQETYFWRDIDDPFRWRDRLPFVRVGLAEAVLLGGLSLVLTGLATWIWWPLAFPFLIVTACIFWFFRDPDRQIPTEAGKIVSPADGRIATVMELDDDELGPCVQIGIFLSIFNAHVNRFPVAGDVVSVRYRPGRMLNALRPESTKQNERMEVTIKPTESPFRMIRVNQITGQFARRIVCWVRPGNHLKRGEKFGMIKLGSRTELLLPRLPGLEITGHVGAKVLAGATVLAIYREPVAEDYAQGRRREE